MNRGGFRGQRGAVWREVSKMSRTLITGRTDTSSSPDKPAVAEVEVAELGRRIDLGIAILEKCAIKDFSRVSLVDVNAAIRGGDRERSALRTWEVPKFAYLHSDDVDADMSLFVERLSRLHSPVDVNDVLEVFFDVHWSVNLHGHYFADACGRTATVVGCWATYELTGQVMTLPSRAEYLSVASHADPRREFFRLCRVENRLV